jgi:hypothetical protein
MIVSMRERGGKGKGARMIETSREGERGRE